MEFDAVFQEPVEPLCDCPFRRVCSTLMQQATVQLRREGAIGRELFDCWRYGKLHALALRELGVEVETAEQLEEALGTRHAAMLEAW